MSNWDHVSSRLGNIKSETRQIAKEIYDAAQDAGHDIWFMWGMGSSQEHSTGLALDLMVRNEAAGDWIRDYIWKNRARLRLRHVIWWQHILSTVNRPGVRRKMADRGSVTENHYDHLHVWFFGGAYRAPAGTVTQPATETSGVVRKVQKALEVTVDGKWGPDTDTRAIRMRTACRLKRGVNVSQHGSFNIKDVQEVIDTKIDGIWGPKSDAALISWVKTFQAILNVKVDGWWGPKTDGKFISVRRRHLNKY